MSDDNTEHPTQGVTCLHPAATNLMVAAPPDQTGVVRSVWYWCSECGALASKDAPWTLPRSAIEGNREFMTEEKHAEKTAEHSAADVIAYVVALVLDVHARAGTDLKSSLDGMVTNYRARAPQAMRVVRDALADAKRRKNVNRRYYREHTGQLTLLEEAVVVARELLEDTSYADIPAWVRRTLTIAGAGTPQQHDAAYQVLLAFRYVSLWVDGVPSDVCRDVDTEWECRPATADDLRAFSDAQKVEGS